MEQTAEMAAQSIAYHAHGTADSAFIHGLCAMTLYQQCCARSAHPHDDKSSD